MFCHHGPQLAITFCRKQLLTQQGTNALEDTPSKSEIFFFNKERPENILIQELSTASTYLSVL